MGGERHQAVGGHRVVSRLSVRPDPVQHVQQGGAPRADHCGRRAAERGERRELSLVLLQADGRQGRVRVRFWWLIVRRSLSYRMICACFGIVACFLVLVSSVCSMILVVCSMIWGACSVTSVVFCVMNSTVYIRSFVRVDRAVWSVVLYGGSFGRAREHTDYSYFTSRPVDCNLCVLRAALLFCAQFIVRRQEYLVH